MTARSHPEPAAELRGRPSTGAQLTLSAGPRLRRLRAPGGATPRVLGRY